MTNNTVSEVERMMVTRVFDAPRELVWKAWTDPKYIKETIFSQGTISWYSTAFQNSCPSGALMQQRSFPPTRKSPLQTGEVKPFGPHHCMM